VKNVREIYDQLQAACGGEATPRMLVTAIKGHVKTGFVFDPKDLDSVYEPGSKEVNSVLRGLDIRPRNLKNLNTYLQKIVKELKEEVKADRDNLGYTRDDWESGSPYPRSPPIENVQAVLESSSLIKFRHEIIAEIEAISTLQAVQVLLDKYQTAFTAERLRFHNVFDDFSNWFDGNATQLPPGLDMNALSNALCAARQCEVLEHVISTLKAATKYSVEAR
jgi:hypothetical protein